MRTLTDTLAALQARGFTANCRVVGDGVQFLPSKEGVLPQQLRVHAMVRLEGTSAPDEQSLVVALEDSKSKRRGCLCATYPVRGDLNLAQFIEKLPEPLEPTRAEARAP